MERQCHEVAHLPRKWNVNVTNCHARQANGTSTSRSATRATQMERQCHDVPRVPRVPRKWNVNVTKCHTCHVKRRSMWRIDTPRRWWITKLCEKDSVWQSWVRRMVCVCVTKLCVKDAVWERKCVWQSCVWQSGVWKMVCDKVGWERWCVTKLCEKDGGWQSGVWKMVCVCDKVVCEGCCVRKKVCVTKLCVTKWCVKDGVWQSWVRKMVCDKVVWERWCVTKWCVVSVWSKEGRRRRRRRRRRDTEPKTRTPYKDVGKNVTNTIWPFMTPELRSLLVLHIDLRDVLLKNWARWHIFQWLKNQMQMAQALNIHSTGVRLALELASGLSTTGWTVDLKGTKQMQINKFELIKLTNKYLNRFEPLDW